LYHVYQKSISELLNKLLNIQDDSTRTGDDRLSSEIKQKQHLILHSLIGKLGPEATEEDNLNASSILQDALETKEFYSVVSKRNNVSKMLDYALPEGKTNVDS
jgi:hypothetical protein